MYLVLLIFLELTESLQNINYILSTLPVSLKFLHSEEFGVTKNSSMFSYCIELYWLHYVNIPSFGSLAMRMKTRETQQRNLLIYF